MFKFALLSSLLAVTLASPTPRACADVTVIFARGTTEAAPIGSVVGPPFEAALQSALGGKTLSFVGVNYAADVAGFLEGGDPAGASTMASDIESTASSCPSTKIVMSGYSQGAQLVHLAAAKLSASVENHVSSVVMFGDPDNGKALAGAINGRSLTFCAVGDDICLGGDLILPAHLSYGADAGAAAAFVVSKL